MRTTSITNKSLDMYKHIFKNKKIRVSRGPDPCNLASHTPRYRLDRYREINNRTTNFCELSFDHSKGNFEEVVETAVSRELRIRAKSSCNQSGHNALVKSIYGDRVFRTINLNDLNK